MNPLSYFDVLKKFYPVLVAVIAVAYHLTQGDYAGAINLAAVALGLGQIIHLSAGPTVPAAAAGPRARFDSPGLPRP